MSIRLNIRSSSRTHISQTPRLSFNKLDSLPQRSKSQSGSRTRSHAPKPRPSTTMESPTPTPTPRRSRRHNKGSQRPEQRDLLPALQLDSASDREIISDDELLDLLVPTVTSIMPDTFKAKGILAVSKADINDSKKKGRRGKKAVVEGEIERMPTQTDANRKTPGGKKGNKKSHAVEKGFDVIEPVSDTPSHSTGTPTRKGKNNNIQGISKPSGVTSALAANKSVKSSTRANHDDYAHFDIKAEPFDMSILSRSLPSQHEDMANGIHNQRKGKKQNDLWDMPAEIATEVPTVSIRLRPYAVPCSSPSGNNKKRLEYPSLRSRHGYPNASRRRLQAPSSRLVSIPLDPTTIVEDRLTVFRFPLTRPLFDLLLLYRFRPLIRTGHTISALMSIVLLKLLQRPNFEISWPALLFL